MKNFSGSFINGKFVPSQTQENNSNDENNNNNNKEIKTNDINTYSNFTVSNTISFNPPETIENNNNENNNNNNNNENNNNNNENNTNNEDESIINTSTNASTTFSFSPPNESPQINPLFLPSQQEKSEDAQEIAYIMKSMEKLRNSNPLTFFHVLQTNKKILDLVESNSIKTFSDIKSLNSIFKEVEDIDIDYLFWCVHKSIKIAAIKHKNLPLIHYFILNKGFKLNNKSIYHNFINEYVKSLNNINFLECENEKMEKFVAILQMLINQGECDVNDNEFDPVQNTPLHYAIAFKQLQFVIVLMKFKKTDLNKINANGDTPMDFAVENLFNGVDVQINKEFCKLMIMFGGKCNSMKEKYKILFEDEENKNLDENEKNLNENLNENKKNENEKKKKKIVVCENVGTDDNNNNNVEENVNVISKNKEEEKK